MNKNQEQALIRLIDNIRYNQGDPAIFMFLDLLETELVHLEDTENFVTMTLRISKKTH